MQLDDISSVGVMTMASTLTCSIAAGSSMTMNASVTASVNGSAKRAKLGGQQVDDRIHAQVFAAPDRKRGAEHGEPQENRRGQLIGPDQRPVHDIAGDDADEEEERLDHHQRRAQQFERASDAAIDDIDQRCAAGCAVRWPLRSMFTDMLCLVSPWRTRRARG